MNEFEIMFTDLTEEAQQRLLDFYGVQSATDMNWDVFPITTLYTEDQG